MRLFCILILSCLGCDIAALENTSDEMAERIQAQMRVSDRHQFDLRRDEPRKPFEAFSFLGLKEGMTAMDVGAYAGYTTEMLSAAVGPEGKVYSQHRERVLLNYADGYYKRTMDERLANNRLPNVVLHLAEYENLGLEAELDFAFLGNLIHDFYYRDGEAKAMTFLASIKKALKPGGILGVTDHVGVSGRDNANLHRIEPDIARRLLTNAGFHIEAESDLFANPQDDHSLMVYNEAIYLNTDRFLFRAVKPVDKLVPARTVAAPQAASDELRNVIESSPALNAGPPPSNEAEWRAAIKAREQAQAGWATDIANAFGVTIDTRKIAGIPAYFLEPLVVDSQNEKRLFVYLHGGAYVFGGGTGSSIEASVIAARANIRALSIDYRMPPDHPFPVAVQDVVKVYRQLIKDYAPEAIALGGTSAGGGLTLASVQRMQQLGLPLPGALYAGTPWADLTATSDTLHTNRGIDRILPGYDGVLVAAALLYANGKPLSEPLLSPLYGNFDQFPPTYLVSGTRDLLLSDTVRVHRALRRANVTADLHVYEGMSHAGYILPPETPESIEVYAELRAFLDTHLR